MPGTDWSMIFTVLFSHSDPFRLQDIIIIQSMRANQKIQIDDRTESRMLDYQDVLLSPIHVVMSH